MNANQSGDFEQDMKRLVNRCSNLEGFVWMLWRAGVIKVEGANVLVNGVDVPEQFSEVVREALAEFQQDHDALFSRPDISGSDKQERP